MPITGFTKNFVVKNGLTTGNITLDASSSNITANVVVANISVPSTANLGLVGNIYIGGGSSGDVLSTDGTGNLTWVAQTGGGSSYSNANVALYLPTYTGLISGTLSTQAQPNVTSLGTLTSINVSGNVTAGNILTNNLLYANGDPWDFGAAMGGYSNSNVAAYLPTFTGNSSAGNFIGNGYFITSINGGNVTGDVSGANHANIADVANSVAGGNVTGQVGNALVAGTVYSNTQPNITSLGTLTSVNVSGNVTTGNILTNNLLYANGVAWNLNGSYSNSNVQAYLPTYTGLSGAVLSTGGQPNVTQVGTLANLSVTGNISTAGNVIGTYYGNGFNLFGIYGSNVIGQVANALVAGTVYSNAQPNITSVGTLQGVSVNGNIDVTGNINVTGNLNYSNVTDLVVGDPLIYIGANNTSNIYDLGIVASYNDGTYQHTGIARDSSDGIWKLFTGVTAEPTTVIDWANATYAGFKVGNITSGNASLGNLAIANYFSGNGYLLTSLTGGNVTGQVGNALIAGTVYANVQPNITSLGTLVSVDVSGNVSSGGNIIGNGYYLTNVNGSNVSGDVAGSNHANIADVANSVAGGNVSGQVANSLVSGTVYSNAQPNITSVGTLTSLLVSGNITTGNILGNGYYLSGIYGSNVIGQVSNSLVAGTVYSNVQPNITSVGTLVSLDVTANVAAGNILTNNLLYANGVPWDFAAASGSYGNSNVEAYLPTYTGLIGGTLSSTDQPNVTQVGTLANLSVSGNISTAGNVIGTHYGNGFNLIGINGSNVIGQVGNSLVSGTVYTQTQPNITSVGTLSTLTVSGLLTATGGGIKTSNIQDSGGTNTISVSSGTTGFVGNITVGTGGTGNVTATYFIGDGSLLTNLTAGNITGQVANALVSGTVYNPIQGNITSLGTLASLSVTGNVSSGGNVIGTHYGNGYNLFGLYGSNVIGQVSNALIAGTVYNPIQGNITSLGTLANITLSANSNITMSGSLSTITGVNNVSATYFTGTLATAGQPNITQVGTLANLSVTGNVSSGGNVIGTHYGNGFNLQGIYASNVIGQVSNALISGTVYTAAQPNITSLGTLTSLGVTGFSNFTGLATFASTQDVTVSGAPTGTVAYDLYNGVVFDVTPSANWTANVSNIPTVNNRSTVVTFIINQGATPYVPNVFQISGANQTVKWVNSTAPGGTASKIDVIAFSMIRSNVGAWTVLGQYATYG